MVVTVLNVTYWFLKLSTDLRLEVRQTARNMKRKEKGQTFYRMNV